MQRFCLTYYVDSFDVIFLISSEWFVVPIFDKLTIEYAYHLCHFSHPRMVAKANLRIEVCLLVRYFLLLPIIAAVLI